MARPHLSLIIPVYNGASRLEETLRAVDDFRAAAPCSLEVLFVDDCSTDPRTPAMLEAFAAARDGVQVLRNERNRGKGHSVARGMLKARGAFRVFTDVDLAYPLSETRKILRALEGGADVAIACRVLPESRYLMSPSFFHYLYTRHLMSRAFNLMVRVTLLPGVLDTQAGLKGFTAEAAHQIFTRSTIAGFGFDIECLYIAHCHRMRVENVAVDFRYDDEPTTVRFVRDSLRMARDIATVRWNGWTGRYVSPIGPLAGEADGPVADAATDSVAHAV
ncbi:MAG TPA: glycosyltransferase [Gemmatimonadaceae bacterium]|jgi:dolichyl-phosphate beta-glucosyltransferase|nr:glycosyltransferase [Gemmatimonadaceae bacterium]